MLHPSFEPVLFLSESVFFALAGYYAEHRFDMHRCSKRLCVSVGVLNAICLSIMALMTHQLILSGESDPSQLERFFGCFICIPTISLYLLVKSFSMKIKSPTLRNILSSLGGAVFGVYLIEKFGRKLVKLPIPEFYVFYNGKDDYPTESVMKLSDAFMQLGDNDKLKKST